MSTEEVENRKSGDAAVQAIVLVRAWHDQDRRAVHEQLDSGLPERMVWALLTMLDRSFAHLADRKGWTWDEFVDHEMTRAMLLAEGTRGKGYGGRA